MGRLFAAASAGHERLRAEAWRACDTCVVHHRAICSALNDDELAGLNQIASHRRLRAGQRIISDQEHVEYFAIIIAGSVKLEKLLPDGRRQVVGLLLPSDFVGRPFEARGSYHAEAATAVQLCSFPAARFEQLMQQYPGIGHRLFRHALSQLDAAQNWMLLLGRKTAQEKVASLLLMIAGRLRELGVSESDGRGGTGCMQLELPLSRSEIADYLGLTIETVSRQFRILKSDGVIKLGGTRSLTILDASKLEAMATSAIV